jgi:hypothetical protein
MGITYEQWLEMERVSNKQLRPAIYLPEIDCELSIQDKGEKFSITVRGHKSSLPIFILNILNDKGEGVMNREGVELIFNSGMTIDLA